MARRRKIDKRVSLDAWRQLTPAEALDVREELLVLAIGVTAFADDGDRVVVTTAAGGGDRGTRAALDVARRLELLHKRPSGLSWTWILIAATGSIGPARSAAAAALAIKLIGLSSKGFGVLQDDGEDGARQYGQLAHQWLQLAASYGHMSNLGGQAIGLRFALLAKASPDDQDPSPADQVALNGAVPVPAAGFSMVVAGQGTILPASRSSEDKAFAQAWSFLSEPMQLVAGPSPDLLEAVLLAEFPWLFEAIGAVVGDLRLRH